MKGREGERRRTRDRAKEEGARERERERELTGEITLPILLPITRTYAYACGLLLLPFTLVAHRSRLTHLHTPVHPRDPPPRFLEFFLRNDASHQPWVQRAAVIHLALPRNSRPAAAGLVLLMMACLACSPARLPACLPDCLTAC